MTGRTTYRVMIYREATKSASAGFHSVSGDYVQRASAFKRAQRLANAYRSRRVRVWEYRGPGASTFHDVSPDA